mmetsp:Transcript_26125/g.46023  ORF Transcript_26125/g.46023 Transcript_26125/m.46023 type:complete len:84 (-) Transcript_26125:96-347(-)|eukprot:CAMPEP_0205904672 /NCGR_PEP_ID=MMETSP1325-20131115/871_1 /ASSEMBLY_ACC=CAM_ASM_000708 /TAXON_ID=236786 /ORGANISM="Florenciella sp., Strain RCC1007" /LENGTH=83 /DNA_ID=CAMNT_0053270483 /DNA_START=214 /DNA_END=465 /DNA_ORIENTATION=-
MGLFIGVQWVIFVLMGVSSLSINELPTSVQIQLERQRFICSKLIDHLPDEEEEELLDEAPQGETEEDPFLSFIFEVEPTGLDA